MRILNKLFLILPITLMITACNKAEGPHSYNGYEQPVYEIVQSDIIDEISYEIRDYAPRLMAKVTVEGAREDAIGDGFRILAAYIFGDNIAQKDIPMTSPVTQTKTEKSTDIDLSVKIPMTSPVTQTQTTDNAWIVTFDMPDNYTLETLPKTKDDRINFYETAPMKRVNVRFSGLMSDEKITDYTAKLNSYVETQELSITGAPEIAYYDDPFTLPWNRRNEISYKIAE